MRKGLIFVGLIVLCLVLDVWGDKPEDKNDNQKHNNGKGHNNGQGHNNGKGHKNGFGEKNDHSKNPNNQQGDRKPQQSFDSLISKPTNQQPDKQHNNCYGPNPVNPIIEDENNNQQPEQQPSKPFIPVNPQRH